MWRVPFKIKQAKSKPRRKLVPSRKRICGSALIQHIWSESAAAEWRVAMCEEQISLLLLSERRIVTSCLPCVKMGIGVNGSRRLLSSAKIIEQAIAKVPAECRHGFRGGGKRAIGGFDSHVEKFGGFKGRQT